MLKPKLQAQLGIVTGNPGVSQGTGLAGLTGIALYTGKAQFIGELGQ